MEATIAAISTPKGRGGIAVIRVSGADAIKIVDKVFEGKKRLSSLPSHTIQYGWIRDPETDELLDEVLVSIFRSPRSYTCEDMVEVSCHGGIAVSEAVLRAILSSGARLAKPGEFTKRALLNGRIDLSQAEAVLDLINAQTDRARKVALSLLRGRLSSKIERLSQKIKERLAEVEAELQFFEEETIDTNRDLRGIEEEIEELIEMGERGRFLREGLKVVILGRPNVGKSSLFNRIIGEERAIVSEIPATTRDSIEGLIELDGLPVHLFDTAGWFNPESKLDALGVEKTREFLNRADLLLLVFDISSQIEEEDIALLKLTQKRERIIALNKIDLEPKLDKGFFKGKVLEVSAKYGYGIEDLKREIVERYRVDGESPIVTNLRHLEALKRALKALKTSAKQPYLETEAIELKKALDALGEIIGKTTPEEIINKVFENFCIGK